MWARSCARCGVSKVFFSPSGHQLLNTERCSSFGLSYTSTTVYKLFSVLIAWVTNLTDLSHIFQWFLFSRQHLQAAIMLSCSSTMLLSKVFHLKKQLWIKNVTFQNCSAPQAAAELINAKRVVVREGGSQIVPSSPEHWMKSLKSPKLDKDVWCI